MHPIEAQYEDGLLKPAKPLHLHPGERVGIILVRRPDPKRWDLARLAATAPQDAELLDTGLSDWAAELDALDRP